MPHVVPKVKWIRASHYRNGNVHRCWSVFVGIGPTGTWGYSIIAPSHLWPSPLRLQLVSTVAKLAKPSWTLARATIKQLGNSHPAKFSARLYTPRVPVRRLSAYIISMVISVRGEVSGKPFIISIYRRPNALSLARVIVCLWVRESLSVVWTGNQVNSQRKASSQPILTSWHPVGKI